MRAVGGVLIAVGDGAHAVVSRGVPALRRRARQRVSHWAAAGVAPAHVGEREGVASDPSHGIVAVVDGEVLVGDRLVVGPEAAHVILRAYRQDGSGLRAPSGQFAAAVWDTAASALVLVVDRLGSRPLYLGHHNGLTLVASELKALLAAGLEPVLDLDGAAELVSYEHLLGDRTLLAGVRLLPPASTTVIAGGEVRMLDRGRYRLRPAAEADLDASVRRFGSLLDRAVLRRRDADTGLALSGGLDSRCVAAIAMRRWPECRAFTFGTAGSEELERAAAVARLTGLPHTITTLAEGYVARDAAETVWLTEGQIRCFHSHHLALRTVRHEHHVRSLLVGFAGDVVVRAGPTALSGNLGFRGGGDDPVGVIHARSAVAIDDVTFERVLTSRFASELRGRARDGLRRAFERLDGPFELRRLDFAVEEVYRRKILPGVELFADDVVHRDPYLDDDLVDFLARIPLQLRSGGSLQRAYLRRFRSLARVPSPKEGVAPSLEGRRRTVALAAVRSRRRVRSRADRVLRSLDLVPHTGYADYAAHLRGDSGARLLGVLVDERTLDRGQIRPEGIRRLVDDTVAGRASHAQVLGTLLTLELFQRQFVDGDGFARLPAATPILATA